MERRNVKLEKTLEVLKKLQKENISIDDLVEAVEVINEIVSKDNTTEEEQNILSVIRWQEEESPQSIELEITDQLHRFGIPCNIKGFDFIRTGILIGLQDPRCLRSATKEMYPSIAKECGTTSSRVERVIRHAIEVAWAKGNLEEILKFFPYDTHITSMKFLSRMVEYYRYKYHLYLYE